MKEWQRTIVLCILLAVALGFLWWVNHSATANLTSAF